MKVRFDINGLDCPHCALELENKMKAADGIDDASINFAFKSLTVDVADDADEEAVLSQLQGIADNFEDGIAIDFRD